MRSKVKINKWKQMIIFRNKFFFFYRGRSKWKDSFPRRGNAIRKVAILFSSWIKIAILKAVAQCPSPTLPATFRRCFRFVSASGLENRKSRCSRKLFASQGPRKWKRIYKRIFNLRFYASTCYLFT